MDDQRMLSSVQDDGGDVDETQEGILHEKKLSSTKL